MNDYKEIYNEYNNTDLTFDELYKAFIGFVADDQQLVLLNQESETHYNMLWEQQYQEDADVLPPWQSVNIHERNLFMFRTLCENEELLEEIEDN